LRFAATGYVSSTGAGPVLFFAPVADGLAVWLRR